MGGEGGVVIGIGSQVFPAPGAEAVGKAHILKSTLCSDFVS